MGLLRLLTTEAVMRENVISSHEAWRVYDSILEDDRVQFSPEPVLFDHEWRRLSSSDRPTPKVWTDAYLSAFALAAGMRFVTMDRAVATNATDTLILA